MKVLFEVKGLNWSESECKEALVKMLKKEVEILSFSVDEKKDIFVELLESVSLSANDSLPENVNIEEVSITKEKKKKILKKNSKQLVVSEEKNIVEVSVTEEKVKVEEVTEEKVNVEEVLVTEEKVKVEEVTEEKNKKKVKKNSKKVLSEEEKEELKAKKKEETKAKKEEEKAKKKEETKAKKEEEKAKKKEELKSKKEEEKAKKKEEFKSKKSFLKVTEEVICETFPKVEEYINITYEGKEYMKLIKGNLVVNMEGEDVGRYNETTKKIDFYEEEFEEEEYEK